ncbi:MAG: ABC transporter ATP-binding protein [Deltaproteobacteria bacterium]|nr:ABC transporter ATP-binding protein [Deltaproteobacteria bacterium]
MPQSEKIPLQRPRKKEIENIRGLFSLLRLHPWAIPAIIGLGALSSLAEGFGISLFIPFLNGMEQPAFHPDTGIWLADTLAGLFNHVAPAHRLMVIAWFIFGAILLKALLSFSTTALFAWLDMHAAHRLRSCLFNRILRVEYGFIEASPSGKLYNTLATETWRTRDALETLVDLIISLCMIVVYTALLLLISWKLTVLVIIFMSMISVLVRVLNRYVKNLSSKLTHTNALFYKRMVQALEGMKVVRAFGREPYEQNRFNKASEGISRLVMKLTLAAGLVNPVYEILAGGLLVYVLFTALRTPAGLTALLVFIFILYRLQPKIKELDEQCIKLSSLSASVADVMSLLDHAAIHPSSPSSGNVPVQDLKKGIHLHHVSFYYPNSKRPALRDVSISIEQARATALVGPSGGGKSTLIKLVLRLYDPTEGEILVDDRPLRQLDLALWRKQIAMVSQDVYLFDATVRENIAYGRLDADPDEIVEAARQADAHGFISQLPDGYDTQIGERGVRLSGGQQQRIAMARAFLRKPQILILDEPTSVLDTISESLIQDAIQSLRQECTVLIVAHRLSTIQQADHIVVLEQGRVCEQGDLRQLLAAGGLFAKLYELQFPKNTA